MDGIVNRAVTSIFGRRFVDNRFRPILVEAMIAEALEPEWEWCAGDWAAWDFVHAPSGVRLEVKQTASQQSWRVEAPSVPQFDIRARTSRYEGNKKIQNLTGQRFADIYLFARHERMDGGADHRDPLQWRFLIALENRLPTPPAKTIRWSVLEPIQDAVVDIGNLKQSLERTRTQVTPRGN